MSVNCTMLIMLCAPVPMPGRDGTDDQKYEPFIESTYDKPLKGLSICSDGMSGKYCYAGYTLLKSKELMAQEFEFHGKPGYVVELPTPTQEQVLEVYNLIREKLGVEVALDSIAVRVIFHYS